MVYFGINSGLIRVFVFWYDIVYILFIIAIPPRDTIICGGGSVLKFNSMVEHLSKKPQQCNRPNRRPDAIFFQFFLIFLQIKFVWKYTQFITICFLIYRVFVFFSPQWTRPTKFFDHGIKAEPPRALGCMQYGIMHGWMVAWSPDGESVKK